MRKLLAAVVALVVGAGCVALFGQGMLRAWADAHGAPTLENAVPPAQPSKADKANDEKAILEALFDYREAFNRGDVEAIAKHFSEHAELVDEAGEAVHGRDAIRKVYADFLQANPGAQVQLETDWFRWVSADVVVGHGKAKITAKSGLNMTMSYSAVHAKRDGKWPIVMIREALGQAKPAKTREQSLHELDWLVGDFVDSDDSGTLKIQCKWSRNKAYLVRSFTVSGKDGVELEGHEIIGWDAARGVLRSWVFDTNGGFGEGTWKHKNKTWYCSLTSVRPDGAKASAVHIFTPTGDHYTFQSIGRTLDGEVQPDIEEVTVRRVPNKSDT